MFVTYTPEDGSPPQTWDFNPNRVRSSEQVIVEKQYGEAWARFVIGVKTGEAFARRILLWHLIRREHPAHQFRDTPDFYDDEFVVEQTFAELTEAYDGWVSAGGRDKEHGDLLDRMFQDQIQAAADRGDERLGKALSKKEPKPTSGR